MGLPRGINGFIAKDRCDEIVEILIEKEHKLMGHFSEIDREALFL
jgi:hypothetical protein